MPRGLEWIHRWWMDIFGGMKQNIDGLNVLESSWCLQRCCSFVLGHIPMDSDCGDPMVLHKVICQDLTRSSSKQWYQVRDCWCLFHSFCHTKIFEMSGSPLWCGCVCVGARAYPFESHRCKQRSLHLTENEASIATAKRMKDLQELLGLHAIYFAGPGQNGKVSL